MMHEPVISDLTSIPLSVIIPVYNGGRYLARCLSAIQQSTYQQFELIVVDNGSTDTSVDIATSFHARIFHCPGPSGPGAARNMGAQHATHDILLFIDADVVVHADTLARVAAHFHNDPDCAAVFGSYDTNPAAGNLLSQYKNLLHHYVHQHANRNARTFWAGCGAVRKSSFHAIGRFDTKTYPFPSIEDIELGDRLYRQGFRLVLDKHIFSQHLKEWRLGSLIYADIWCRAIPWSRLILSRQGLLDDLNVGHSQRVSAASTWAGLISLPLGFLYPALFSAAILSVILVLLLNYDLFKFFWRLRGPMFAASVLPMHLLYFLYSSLAFAWATGEHLLLRGRA